MRNNLKQRENKNRVQSKVSWSSIFPYMFGQPENKSEIIKERVNSIKSALFCHSRKKIYSFDTRYYVVIFTLACLIQ